VNIRHFSIVLQDRCAVWVAAGDPQMQARRYGRRYGGTDHVARHDGKILLMMSRRLAAAMTLLFLGAFGAFSPWDFWLSAAAADDFVREDMRIPMASAGPGGLEALLVRPKAPGRYPLALINHGSPRSASERPDMTPLALLPQALEFARRGWAALVTMRRGYGGSGGSWAEGFGSCDDPHYLAAAAASVADQRAAIAFVSQRPDIDPARIISVGVSAGGFASVALAANAPPNLVAAISFAGGRGSEAADEVCRKDRLVEAFRSFGRTARVPMLWVYAENDHFFGPALARQFKDAFTGGGGNVAFVAAPAFGADGHGLFSRVGIPQWTPLVDDFLNAHDLILRKDLLPLPELAKIAPPSQLSAAGRAAFAEFLASPPHKAFAVTPQGRYGWKSAGRSVDAAKTGALDFCKESDCRVIVVDDAAVP
jgi:dienelactone hydrolase